MAAAARRLRIVPALPPPEPAPTPKPAPVRLDKWGPLAEPVDPLVTHERAAWTSFLTRGGVRRDHTDMTDLRALARAIRNLQPAHRGQQQ